MSHGVYRLPEIANVPYLDGTAAESADGKSIVLFCVNRHLSHAESAEIDLTSLGARSGTAKISTLAGESILDENDDVHPS